MRGKPIIYIVGAGLLFCFMLLAIIPKTKCIDGFMYEESHNMLTAIYIDGNHSKCINKEK